MRILQMLVLHHNFFNVHLLKTVKEVKRRNSSCNMTGAAVDSFDHQ